MKERTFAIIKPDAVVAKNAGNIIAIIEKNSFDILRMQKVQLTKNQAEAFYAEHKDKSFFGEVIEYMTSGPVVLMVLEKENSIKAWRDLMGATDPAKAEEGTIRKLYGTNIGSNAAHGSDASGSAAFEIRLFFPDL